MRWLRWSFLLSACMWNLACSPSNSSADGAAGDASTGTMCRSDRECTSTGQVCERTQGVCVQCVTAADCLGANQLCERNQCVVRTPCMSSRQCPGRVCSMALGYCVDCNADVDCAEGQACTDNQCIARPPSCTSSRQCSDRGQVCDPARMVCVDCVTMQDCPTGQTCSSNRCVRAMVPTDAGGMEASVQDVVMPPVDVPVAPPDVVMPPPDVVVPSSGTCFPAGDPRNPTISPFQNFVLNGSAFLPGGSSYNWRVRGTLCDDMLVANGGGVTFALQSAMPGPTTAAGASLTFRARLLGEYVVTVSDGTRSCDVPVRVTAGGMRVEMCWAPTTNDIDLWLHDPRNMMDFTSANICNYANCRNSSTFGTGLNWGYAAAPAGTYCNDMTAGGTCNSPRLEFDAISAPDAAEAIVVDAPRDGESFRVAVEYFSGRGAVTPIVRVHCGGSLVRSLGGVTTGAMRFGETPIPGIATPGNGTGSFWRVADVTWRQASNTCEVFPLVNTGGAPCVETGMPRTFAGGCRR